MELFTCPEGPATSSVCDSDAQVVHFAIWARSNAKTIAPAPALTAPLTEPTAPVAAPVTSMAPVIVPTAPAAAPIAPVAAPTVPIAPAAAPTTPSPVSDPTLSGPSTTCAARPMTIAQSDEEKKFLIFCRDECVAEGDVASRQDNGWRGGSCLFRWFG